ncbi:MAG: hypothetical protein ABS81_07395 [Pseudonocardia sp. SCN 72-86]|nr:MAG: hypothetical protein ABS81_07395 [Pseudonocardia sp. SCN 72-86]
MDDFLYAPDRYRAVRDSIARKRAARPRVDNNGRPLPWDQQTEAYRAVTDRKRHEDATRGGG